MEGSETAPRAVIDEADVLSASVDASPDKALLDTAPNFPKSSFAVAKKSKDGNQFPQIIAHRGYKAAHPENTMASFRGAVEVGTDAIETDIHLSQDGVVVLSHDATLKRCYGRNEKIIDTTWEQLSELQTIREPKQNMPRFLDLLEYLTEPGREHVWILLDIKPSNDGHTVMRLLSETINSVTPAKDRPWKDRILLGVWTKPFFPLCYQYLPGYSVIHINFFTLYVTHDFSYENVSFNMFVPTLVGPLGAYFAAAARQRKRALFGWTVNEDKVLRWCIRRKLDGVCTDDPKKFLAIRDNWMESDWVEESWTFRQLARFLWINIVAVALSVFVLVRYRTAGFAQSGRQAKR